MSNCYNINMPNLDPRHPLARLAFDFAQDDMLRMSGLAY